MVNMGNYTKKVTVEQKLELNDVGITAAADIVVNSLQIVRKIDSLMTELPILKLAIQDGLKNSIGKITIK